MSNNLQPQYLSAQNQQTSPMDSLSHSHAQVLHIEDSLSSGLAPQQLHMEPLSNTLASHQAHVGLFSNSLEAQQLYVEPLSNSNAPQQFTVSSKEVTERIYASNSPRPQNALIPNRLATHMFLMPNMGLQQIPVPKKRRTQGESIARRIPGESMTRKILMEPVSRKTPGEPMPNKLGGQQLQGTNKRNAPTEPSESVRSKLRESLADALALVSVQPGKGVESNSQSAAANKLDPDNENSHIVESTSTPVDVDSFNATSGNAPSKDIDSVEKINEDLNPYKENSVLENMEVATQTSNDLEQEFQLKYVLLDEDASMSNSFLIKDDFLQGNGLCWESDLDLGVAGVPETHCVKKPKLTHEVDGNGDRHAEPSPKVLATRIEAELFKLFGGVNKKYKEKGRSLLFNLKDRNNPELRERVMSGEISPERLCSMTAEELASKELSEWRMAKAEELAQMVVLPESEVDVRRLVKKTHKGEFQVEFEQYDGASVEVAVGSTLLSQYQQKSDEKESSRPPKSHETQKSKVTHDKVNVEGQHSESGLAKLSSDSTDLMHGLLVDDLKDADLPPIVSLDEFMESLDSEPPFESLSAAAAQSESTSDEKKDFVPELESSAAGVGDIVDDVSDKLDKVEMEISKENASPKSKKTTMELETPLNSGQSPAGEHLWEGLVQLNISSISTAFGYFKSGEKTSVKEWPSLLDIKGRVRLEAFSKFLQELHMSRSRAIMVLHFCWKEGSPEEGRSKINEVVDSYVADERVGFAEPAPGMELYLCPPHRTTVEMLGKHLSKDDTETLNAINNGLIGIVIWRKPHVTSTLSPNGGSHHKHTSKKSNHLRRHEKNSNMKSSASILGPPPALPKPDPIVDDDDVPPGFGPASARDDDDLPEFDFVSNSGRPSSQNPSHNASLSQPSPHSRPAQRPVYQMRELVSKYGVGGEAVKSGQVNWKQSQGIELEPWNDDDDIPEWRPQQLLQPHVLPPPPPPIPHQPVQLMHGFQQQQAQPMPQPQYMNPLQPFTQVMTSNHQLNLPPHFQSQPMVMPQMASQALSLQPLQPPMVMNTNWQAAGTSGWFPNAGPLQGQVPGGGMMQPCSFGPPPDQFYGAQQGRGGGGQGGMEWRPDVSRSRGF
ncbi:hypothetical protein Sjap_018221 [Stephania japonica]|uniref:TFIIS central domain-containing protein n=1 Tax=Stephania japonica TaxID=461633 RepID=A0AAP0I896_9MAGN